jgi:hypothetical protein
MRPHYGQRSSSSAPLTDDEWRAISAYADEECARIKPKNVGAYRATVLARRMEEVINDRVLVKAFAANVVALPAFNPREEPVELIERNAAAAVAAMRRGLAEGRRDRELLAQMTAEQSRDAAW